VIRLLALVLAIGFSLAGANTSGTFTNPILPSGPDPWVLYHNGFYYYMNTTGKNLTLWKSKSIGDLAHAEKKIVWTPPLSGPDSHDIWAPEIHLIGGKWYIYFAADGGDNRTHRLWVLENSSPDPMEGEWVMKGKLADSTDKWAIDPTVFEDNGKLFLVWSGWPGDANKVQNIYIAQLKNPWTIEGRRVLISTPHFRWEKHDDDLGVKVNEGPEILKHDGDIFLIFSASGCWTDDYALGMLQAREGSDLLNSVSWVKSKHPLLKTSGKAHAYGTGHNTFFRSPDGTQDWIIYHANPDPEEGCKDERSPRAQPFTWNADGTPNFGKPVPLGQPLPLPSGEQPGQ